MDREIFDKYVRMYPSFAEMTVNWFNIGLDEINVMLTDGTSIIYDSVENILIFPNRGEDDKEAWTREFGRRLKKRLSLRGISQTQVANYCKVSQPTVSKWLSGKSVPDAYMLTVLADLIGCSTDDLMEYEY